MFISSFGQVSVLWVLKYFGLPLITHWKVYTRHINQKNNHRFRILITSCQQPLIQSREEQQSIIQLRRCLPVCSFPWRQHCSIATGLWPSPVLSTDSVYKLKELSRQNRNLDPKYAAGFIPSAGLRVQLHAVLKVIHFSMKSLSLTIFNLLRGFLLLAEN